MILISLLLVLALERAIVKTPLWQADTYVSKYITWLTDNGWLKTSTSAGALWGLLLLPALVVALIAQVLVGDFISFVLQSVILFIAIGSASLRETYRLFLQAAQRGDLQACSLYTEQLGHCNTLDTQDGEDAQSQGKSFGQHLLWLNYQHYAAIIISYIALGAAGVVFYVLCRECYYRWCNIDSEHKKPMAQMMYALDFIPVRITAFGLLLVGHFSRALPQWLASLANVELPADKLLTEVAAKAEYVDPHHIDSENTDAATEPKILVTLAKRNILLLLALSAVLTLAGIIQ